MAAEPFNSLGGFSVGIPEIVVIDSNGNVVTNVLNLSGNVAANAVYANNYFYANGKPFTGGNGDPVAAGSNTQVQFNSGSKLDASANFTFDKDANLLTIDGSINTTSLLASNIETTNLLAANVDINGGNITNIETIETTNLIASNVDFSGSNVVNLGSVEGLQIDSGLAGQVLRTDGEGNLTWASFNGAFNVLHVAKDGVDTNSGTSWSEPLATVEKALEIAETMVTPVLVDIAPGRYKTKGHIDMPDNTMIRAPHRAVIFEPEFGFEERNVFRMGSGCFIEGPLFEGWRLDSLENPTEGFAISFRPGAVITRAPYAHKIAVRTPPYWGAVAPPLDRENANPLVGRGAGVVLADGAVCSPYSIFPNIMTWGATPVSHNGIGYCAKNGGLINAVNAISIWAHIHFLAIDGGQIILSSCSTQFGDFTMVSKGERKIIQPTQVQEGTLSVQTTAAFVVTSNTNAIINNMWNALVAGGYTTGWSAKDEEFTRRDAGTFLQSMSWVLKTANEKPMLDFAKGLFNTLGEKVYSIDKELAFIFSFNHMRNSMKMLPGITTQSSNIIDALVDALIATLLSPVKVSEPSVITAISHTWTAIMAGVALTKIPPAQNFTTIEESILELNNGVVIASGQDDQGSALFIGGMKIDADTGELTGPPFEQSVNRIATRAAIARSF